ncbi:ribonuclease H-like domain-containing protein [Tanacetum coccineum]
MYVHGTYDDEFVVDDPHTLISKLDISDPLHLHPNDFTALTVIYVKLKGTENYQVWSFVMLLALEGKNKSGFIDRTCMRSNTDEVLGRQWDRINAIVLGLNALWKQFDALIQLPRCTCHAAEDFKKHNQLMKLMQFLVGLDECYMQIRSNILSRDVLPDVRNAYAIISNEESYRVVSSSSSGSGTSQRYSSWSRGGSGGMIDFGDNMFNFKEVNQQVPSGLPVAFEGGSCDIIAFADNMFSYEAYDEDNQHL